MNDIVVVGVGAYWYDVIVYVTMAYVGCVGYIGSLLEEQKCQDFFTDLGRDGGRVDIVRDGGEMANKAQASSNKIQWLRWTV